MTQTSTYTATPVVSATPTATVTLTPPLVLSGLADDLLAPNPLRSGSELALYPHLPVKSSHWEVYRVDLRRIATMDFGAEYPQTWRTEGVAPGLYFIRLAVVYQNGSQRTAVHKVLVTR